MTTEIIQTAMPRLLDIANRHIGTTAFVDSLIECFPDATLEELAAVLEMLRLAHSDPGVCCRTATK